jgi:hypothetical protein
MTCSLVDTLPVVGVDLPSYSYIHATCRAPGSTSFSRVHIARFVTTRLETTGCQGEEGIPVTLVVTWLPNLRELGAENSHPASGTFEIGRTLRTWTTTSHAERNEKFESHKLKIRRTLCILTGQRQTFRFGLVDGDQNINFLPRPRKRHEKKSWHQGTSKKLYSSKFVPAGESKTISRFRFPIGYLWFFAHNRMSQSCGQHKGSEGVYNT